MSGREVGRVQRDPAVVAGQAAVPGPDHLAGGGQLVEHRRGSSPAPGPAAPASRGRWPAARRRPAARPHAARRRRRAADAADALPGRQEPGEVAGRDRLDLGPQRGERPAPDRAQHLGVAEVGALTRPPALDGSQLALDQPPGADQPAQGLGDDGDAEAEPGGDRRGGERAVGAGVPGQQVAERVGRPAR